MMYGCGCFLPGRLLRLKKVAAAHQLRRVIEGQNAQSHDQNGMKNACGRSCQPCPPPQKKNIYIYIFYQKRKTSIKTEGTMLIDEFVHYSSNSQIKFFFGGWFWKPWLLGWSLEVWCQNIWTIIWNSICMILGEVRGWGFFLGLDLIYNIII